MFYLTSRESCVCGRENNKGMRADLTLLAYDFVSFVRNGVVSCTRSSQVSTTYR